ncbi:MAG TPA: RagB/SusD family nutrient uptake outer membrane protein, partial [Chryseolinea sp.]|nr:RagB/SusD family nutrient uptake outer membrane protein [Chryseolinea sp.]
MKTYKLKIVAALITLFFVSSCNDKLDVTDPDAISDELSLSNDKNVKSTLLGAYDGLSQSGLFGGEVLLNSELLASNGEVVFSGTFNDPADIWRKIMTTTNGDVSTFWIESYNTINVCNNVLSALDVVNEDDRDQVEGEALFLRGLTYFELVKYFGQPYSAGNSSSNLAVPLMLVDDRNSLEQPDRATVEEVYTQILEDLTTAESQLAEGQVSGRASKEVAAAILSRVYLQMANYAEARDAANRVIESDVYSLNNSYAACFNNATTNEDIFDIPVLTQDGVNSMQTYYAATTEGGRGDVEVQQEHLDLYTSDDERLDLFYIDESTDEIRVGKWVYLYGNVKIVRLAEMYLTRAECNFRLATAIGDTPLNDVNLIRDRAGLTDLGTVDLAQILHERR